MTDFSLLWPTEYRVITQRFGANPQNYRRFGLPGHEGLDIRAYYGSKIFACADGVVYLTEASYVKPYGFQIRVDHLNGYSTVYAHLKEIWVVVGQRVTAGQVIGLADSTGNSSGSHLHLTLKKLGAQTPGYPAGIIDPLPYLTLEPILGDTYQVMARPSLRVRSGPGFEYSTLALVYFGEFVSSAEYPGVSGNVWTKIRTKSGIVGYCYTTYLKKV